MSRSALYPAIGEKWPPPCWPTCHQETIRTLIDRMQHQRAPSGSAEWGTVWGVACGAHPSPVKVERNHRRLIHGMQSVAEVLDGECAPVLGVHVKRVRLRNALPLHSASEQVIDSAQHDGSTRWDASSSLVQDAPICYDIPPEDVTRAAHLVEAQPHYVDEVSRHAARAPSGAEAMILQPLQHVDPPVPNECGNSHYASRARKAAQTGRITSTSSACMHADAGIPVPVRHSRCPGATRVDAQRIQDGQHCGNSALALCLLCPGGQGGDMW